MKHLNIKNKAFHLVVSLSFCLFSCINLTKSNNSEKNFLAALVVDGAINDASFNQCAWKGMLCAEDKLSYKLAYRETKQANEYTAAFESLLELKPNLILGVGYKLEDETYRQAELNHSTSFACIDVVNIPPKIPNLLTVNFNVEQAAFLAGYIAAHMSQSGKIGFLGGVESEVVGFFDYGYQAGALYAKKDIEIVNQYAQNFFDVSKGRGITELMLQNGVDVIFHAAGPTGRGMIEAVREKQLSNKRNGIPINLWAIGVDVDEYKLAPEIVLTSVIKRVDKAVFNVLEDIKKHCFEGNRSLSLGLEGDYVCLSATTPIHVSSQLLAKVDNLKQEIIKGNIKVPKKKEELEVFRKSLENGIF